MTSLRHQRTRRSRLTALATGIALTASLIVGGPAAAPAGADPDAPSASSTAKTSGPQYLVVGAAGDSNVVTFKADGPRLTRVDKTHTGQLFSLGVVPHPNGKFVYTAGVASGKLTGYRMHTNGRMTPIPDAHKTPGPVTGIVYSPDGKYLFATEGLPNTTVVTYRVHENGALTRLSGARMRTPVSLLSIPVVSPDGEYLYAPSFSGMTMEGFRIGDGGRLTPVGDIKMTGLAPALPSITPNGRFMYVGNEQTHDMNMWRIRKDGTLVDGGRTFVGLIPHGMAIHPNGKWMYFPLTGSQQVQGRRILSDGRLAPLPGSDVLVPGAARVVLSNDAKWLYAVTVAGIHGTADIYTFRVQNDGSIRPAGGPYDTGLVFHDGATAHMIAPGA
ncbi:MAG: beta-propeller fold lactonase family protein [Gordonia sp. (in: high G+C Gram-positive bacteria)]|uniref:lactonase family protein n=1 Tax=Gordonia sp. (in: high G+C Gram-positive bacteria) TaxID=84139 RepID=UPI0039E4A8E1